MSRKLIADIVRTLKSFVPEVAFGGSVTRYYGRGPSDRHSVEHADDFFSDGWQSFTTGSDAPDFGVWVNRGKRMTLQSCEGSWTLVQAHTDAGYNESIDELNEHPVSVTFPQDRSSFLIPIPE